MYYYFCGQPTRREEYGAWYLVGSDMSGGMWGADLVFLQIISARLQEWDLRPM